MLKKNNLISNGIVGTWELKEAQNGMIPSKSYPPGNGDILQFTDSIYKRFNNGILIKTGHYKIVADSSVMAAVGLDIPTGQFTNRMIFDNDHASDKTFIEIKNNRLTLLSGFFPADGGSRISYEKK